MGKTTNTEGYLMKGHTLPGINKASEGDTDLADGRSKPSTFQMKGWSPFTKTSPLKNPPGPPDHEHPHPDITKTRTKDSVTISSAKRGTSSTYNVTNKKKNKDGTVTVTLTNELGNTRTEVHGSKKKSTT